MSVKYYVAVKKEDSPDYSVKTIYHDNTQYPLESAFPNGTFMIGKELTVSHFNLGYSILGDFLDMNFEDIPKDIVKNFTKCFLRLDYRNVFFPVFRFEIHSGQIEDWFFSVYPELFEDETGHTGEDIGDEVSMM